MDEERGEESLVVLEGGGKGIYCGKLKKIVINTNAKR